MNRSRLLAGLLLLALIPPTAAGRGKKVDSADGLEQAARRLQADGVQILGAEHLGEGALAVLGHVIPEMGAGTAPSELASGPAVLFGTRLSGLESVRSLVENLRSGKGTTHAWVAIWPDDDCVSADAGRVAGFLDHLPGGVVAYVHLGPGGVAADGRVRVAGAGTSPDWPAVLERVNVLAGLDLRLSDGLRPCSDATPFDEAGLPTLELIPEGVEAAEGDAAELAGFAARLARTLAKRTSAPVHRPTVADETHPDRTAGTPFTGTVPDYTGSGGGLRLEGVIPDGPAERAGLAEDDVIVEVGGRPIDTIHDYAAVLDTLRIGQPVEVVYLRGDERRRTTLTPTARE